MKTGVFLFKFGGGGGSCVANLFGDHSVVLRNHSNKKETRKSKFYLDKRVKKKLKRPPLLLTGRPFLGLDQQLDQQCLMTVSTFKIDGVFSELLTTSLLKGSADFEVGMRDNAIKKAFDHTIVEKL